MCVPIQNNHKREKKKKKSEIFFNGLPHAVAHYD